MSDHDNHRRSCLSRYRDGNTYLLATLLGIVSTGLIAVFIVNMVGLSQLHKTQPASISSIAATVKDRVPDVVAIIYATVTTTAIKTVSPAPTQVTTVVQNGPTAGIIVAICVAVVCGILLVFVFLGFLARCLATRINRFMRTSEHAGEGCSEARYSGKAPVIKENVYAGYSLRDISGGGDLSEARPVENNVAEDQNAGNDSTGVHVAGDQTVGKHSA